MEEIPFIKYAEITYLTSQKALGKRNVDFFEKLDGSNSQIRRNGWRVFPGRRSGYLDARKWDSATGYKAWMSDFKKWALSNETLMNLPENVVIFGEWLHRKEPVDELPIVTYPSEAYDKFYLIDVAILESPGKIKKMLPYEKAVDLVLKNKVEGIKFLEFFRTKVEEGFDLEGLLNKWPGKKLANEDIEGIVIKDYTSMPSMFWKILSTPYQERTSNEQDPRKKFCTTPRIRKCYYFLLEEGIDNLNPERLTSAILWNIKKETGVAAEPEYTLDAARNFLSRVNRKSLVSN